MRLIFRGAGCLTLLFDAYILLALVATNMMKAKYHHLLPPFDSELAGSTPRIVFLLLVAWTGFLAVGCLYATKSRGAAPQEMGSQIDGAT